jgi:hypothetical protein
LTPRARSSARRIDDHSQKHHAGFPATAIYFSPWWPKQMTIAVAWQIHFFGRTQNTAHPVVTGFSCDLIAGLCSSPLPEKMS